MDILVINGSPKGKNSATLQTVLYLQILHPEHRFEILDAGDKIKRYERDFLEARTALEKADLLLFSYPVYTFVVPSQLHRFVELMKGSGAAIAGKYATQITTSKHFYDVTAHRFIRDNCQDMGLRFIDGLSADMDDLTTDKGQREARDFFDYLVWQMEHGISEPVTVPPPVPAKHVPVTVPESAGEKPGNVIVVTDCGPEDAQLQAMIDRFRAVLPLNTTVVNILDFPIKGGCLGCFNCAVDGQCVYNDGFSELLREKIQTGQAIVTAFTVRDHSKGYRFKLYDDRQFCNGHRTVTMGMPMGYLVCGDLSREENLRLILEAEPQVGGNYLAGIACDEFDPDGEIDAMAAKLAYAIEHNYEKPANFYGVGGMKIFRDLIWLMQGMMKADHKFYKAHGQYDFPQKRRGRMLAMYLVGGMLANPKLKAKVGDRMTEGMIAPYQKALERARKEMRPDKKAGVTVSIGGKQVLESGKK